MTVKELRDCLDLYNDNDLVVMSKDAEGNGFSPLEQTVGNSLYTPESTWSGSVSIKELDDELKEQGYTEEDCYRDETSKECVVLWPVN